MIQPNQSSHYPSAPPLPAPPHPPAAAGPSAPSADGRPQVFIYTRVSTDRQDTENQLRVLRQVAYARGWTVAGEFEDRVSGAKGRDERPRLDEMLMAVEAWGSRRVEPGRGKTPFEPEAAPGAAQRVDFVLAWSVDRLGRSMSDLVGILDAVRTAGAGLYLHLQNLDSSTPEGRAMFQMCGVFAEFERSMIQARVNAGIGRARAAGTRLGRPNIDPGKTALVAEAAAAGERYADISRRLGVSVGTVSKIVGRRRKALAPAVGSAIGGPAAPVQAAFPPPSPLLPPPPPPLPPLPPSPLLAAVPPVEGFGADGEPLF